MKKCSDSIREIESGPEKKEKKKEEKFNKERKEGSDFIFSPSYKTGCYIHDD